ncbi:MAG: putative rane protein, partial [Deltaproteobacteria bacterium]|nr:putative rane protein [Deltaproteobacteria bacterium]
MTRRVAVLRGLAILAVVLYHSAAWGQNAAFFWAHTFRAVQSPNYDQFGAPWYYVSVLIERWAWFSVPAFL